ncbi:MAG: phosphatidylglycerophosphatase A family protein [Candidatus Acidiferrales bacterium]
MNTRTDASPAEPPRKPRLSLFFATVGGVGYLPKAPGTWGSLVGIAVYGGVVGIISILVVIFVPEVALIGAFALSGSAAIAFYSIEIGIGVAIAIFGVAASTRVARFTLNKDPQFVVIDEVSGQYFTYLFALAPLNWKYLLLGFILFRVFDIWKPFPARQAESLPGGWGIMADDWIAAVYAAMGIWIARGIGL